MLLFDCTFTRFSMFLGLLFVFLFVCGVLVFFFLPF